MLTGQNYLTVQEGEMTCINEKNDIDQACYFH